VPLTKLDFAGLPNFAHIPGLPNLDFAWIPKFDFAPLFSGVDFSALLPALDFTPIFGPTVEQLLKQLHDKYPPNWALDISLEKATSVIQDEGLPIVWVPRAEIVEAMLAAEHRSARIDVLLDHIPEVLADCRSMLQQVSHITLTKQVSLAVRALEAFEAGYHEPAQALAVIVTETAVTRVLGESYVDVAKKVVFDPDHVTFAQLRLRAALAPIARFYTPWRPSWGKPPPTALSRHVTVHQADCGHYTRANAAVAVLLVTSVLRASQELQEISDAAKKDEQSATNQV
jgi:hypothetical protein